MQTCNRLEKSLTNILEYAVNTRADILPDILRASEMTSDELAALGYEEENFPELYKIIAD